MARAFDHFHDPTVPLPPHEQDQVQASLLAANDTQIEGKRLEALVVLVVLIKRIDGWLPGDPDVSDQEHERMLSAAINAIRIIGNVTVDELKAGERFAALGMDAAIRAARQRMGTSE